MKNVETIFKFLNSYFSKMYIVTKVSGINKDNQEIIEYDNPNAEL